MRHRTFYFGPLIVQFRWAGSRVHPHFDLEVSGVWRRKEAR